MTDPPKAHNTFWTAPKSSRDFCCLGPRRMELSEVVPPLSRWICLPPASGLPHSAPFLHMPSWGSFLFQPPGPFPTTESLHLHPSPLHWHPTCTSPHRQTQGSVPVSPGWWGAKPTAREDEKRSEHSPGGGCRLSVSASAGSSGRRCDFSPFSEPFSHHQMSPGEQRWWKLGESTPLFWAEATSHGVWYPAVHPSISSSLFACPHPGDQNAEPKRELFPTLCETLLCLCSFGQKIQEEGKRAWGLRRAVFGKRWLRWWSMFHHLSCSGLLHPYSVTSGLEPACFCFCFFSKMLLSTHYVLASVQVFFPEVLLLNPLIWWSWCEYLHLTWGSEGSKSLPRSSQYSGKLHPRVLSLMPLQATPSPTTNYFFPGVTPWGFCFLHPHPRPSMRSPSQICLFVPCIPFLTLSVPDIPQGALSTSPSTNWRPGTVLMMEMTWPWQVGDGCLEGPGTFGVIWVPPTDGRVLYLGRKVSSSFAQTLQGKCRSLTEALLHPQFCAISHPCRLAGHSSQDKSLPSQAYVSPTGPVLPGHCSQRAVG